MTDPFSRDELIEDLLKLDSEDEQEVLQAAQRINKTLNSSGLDWDDLLVVQSGGENIGNEADSIDELGSSNGSDANDGTSVGNEESIKLISKLLARPGCSPELRNELEGYKEDIKSGEFDNSDRRYIKALFNRLNS